MKVIKLDRRHKLFYKGMVYAFKFENEWDERTRVEGILRNIYGWEYDNHDWQTYRGKPVRDKTEHYNRTYPYWIGVRNEADITAVMLQFN